MHISYFFSFFTGVELRHFFPSEMLRGCLVCVICLQLQQYSFLCIQTLHNDCSHIEDVHFLCCEIVLPFFSFSMGVELRHFPICPSVRNILGVPSLCNL